ncbi:MAG: hypothetical protein R8G66_25015 [Cytophagales bacterium]|nr:hypothetical protein [Cytophagales bacterium]
MLHSMVKNCCWRNLRSNSCWLFLFVIQATQAQSWEATTVKAFDSEIVAVSIDFQENIFVALADDQLLKLDKEGQELANFSQPNLAPFTSLEAQNSLNPFFFVRDNQQVVFLDRFLANPVVYDLNQWTSSFVWLASPSVDRQLWLLEIDPFRITKVDRFSGNVLHEVVLQIGFDLEGLVYFGASQQQLILVDQYQGIFIFDLFGNLIRKVEEEDASAVRLIGDQLYYSFGTSLIQIDLNSGEKKETALPDLCGSAIKMADSYLCINDDQLVWWNGKK